MTAHAEMEAIRSAAAKLGTGNFPGKGAIGLVLEPIGLITFFVCLLDQLIDMGLNRGDDL